MSDERPRQRDENPAGIDLPLDPLPGHSSRGRLERVLRRGEFAVTTELNPPDSADPEDVYKNALVLAEVCDAINATDGSGANCHMSSISCCALLTRAGGGRALGYGGVGGGLHARVSSLG